MRKTIGQELDEMFQKAALAHLQKTLKTDHDWAEMETIGRTAEEKTGELERAFREEYGARVDTVRARLFDEAARFRLDHPPPPGGGTTESAIDREARAQVQRAHQADLKRVENEQQRSLEDLLDRAYRRNQTQGMARDAFRLVSDRRSGGDRRGPRQSCD